MKKIIFYTLILFSLIRCSKVLDIPNLNGYDPSLVLSDSNVANAYIGNIYASAFGNWNVGADAQSEQLTGISFPASAVTVTDAGPLTAIPGGGDGGANNDWINNYKRIRLVNQGIINANAGGLTQTVRDNLLGQFYFLRAYIYFGMVKTYGGIPYLKVPQDRYKDSLGIARNSTGECFDLIVHDLDSAIGLLPPHILASTADWGKIDGNFALAFKAKVLLYKASPQFNPSNPWSNRYWSDAYNSNKKAYDDLKNQGYKLVEDYAQIALSEKNSEVVFSVINQFPNKVANWDNGARPGSLSRGPASTGPTWELVKAFPMKDGKQYNDPAGHYYSSSDERFLQKFWMNRDPRFEKSVLWNAKTFPVAGTTSGHRQYTSVGIADPLDSYGINPNSATKSENNNRYSGFFILKNCNVALTQAQVQQYDVDYVVMRFAEVMLNYAEAANETGHAAEALDILRQIRTRAGIEPGNDEKYGITATSRDAIRKAIMDERNIEFCFEGLRFSDLRRWRMFNVLDNKTKHGVEAIAIKADGTEMPLTQAGPLAQANQLIESNFKYSILETPRSGVNTNVLPGSYYFAPIQQSVLAADSKLQQNKDWGGAFNPTLE